VVVVHEALSTLRGKITDVTVGDRLRIGLARRCIDHLPELSDHMPVQGRVAAKVDWNRYAITADDVRVPRGRALDRGEQLGVEAELMDEVRLDLAGQLRVQHLIGVVTEYRLTGNSAQEIDDASPLTVE
jgi:hypothetical protein